MLIHYPPQLTFQQFHTHEISSKIIFSFPIHSNLHKNSFQAQITATFPPPTRNQAKYTVALSQLTHTWRANQNSSGTRLRNDKLSRSLTHRLPHLAPQSPPTSNVNTYPNRQKFSTTPTRWAPDRDSVSNNQLERQNNAHTDSKQGFLRPLDMFTPVSVHHRQCWLRLIDSSQKARCRTISIAFGHVPSACPQPNNGAPGLLIEHGRRIPDLIYRVTLFCFTFTG